MGSDFAFRPAHVGTATDQIGGNTDGDFGRSGRNRLAIAEHRGDVDRRRAQEDAQPVLRLAQLSFQRRNDGFGLSEIRPRLSDVQTACGAGFLLVGDDAERTLLGFDVLAGIAQTLL